MSRIGKQPVVIPEKVDVSINNGLINVKGPNGTISFTHHAGVKVTLEGKEIKVNPVDDSNKNHALWGMTRTLVSNMVTGVTEGFKNTLEFNGVGYKASVSGNTLTLNLGYSHPIEYAIPEGLAIKVVKNTIEISGVNKELVGFAAAKIRSFRKPEPYKGKGVKYADEVIKRKAGKTGGKK